MSEMSDTPRTDNNCWTETGHKNGEVVQADFARQLERELAAKVEECEGLTRRVNYLREGVAMIASLSPQFYKERLGGVCQRDAKRTLDNDTESAAALREGK